MANKSILKWDAGARLGVYLGPLPRHAHSVALVLNVTTSLLSPQFHVDFDNFFKATRFNRAEALLPSAWQHLACFDFEAGFTRSRQQKIAKQQLVPDVVDLFGKSGRRSAIQARGNSSRGGMLHLITLNQKRHHWSTTAPGVDFKKFSTNAWKHWSRSDFANLIKMCSQSWRTSYQQHFSLQSISSSLSLNGEENEVTTCFHGGWSWWCNVLSPGDESAWHMGICSSVGERSQWAC